MSLLDKIKNLLGRRPTEASDSNSGDGNTDDGQARPGGTGRPAAPRPEGSGLGNSVARGAAEGTARESVRKFLEELFDD
ncbi:hypothetical protein [Streptomyces albidoflavus]|uniref:hypothetical protein n=1 Tax=Streptomyces albidoflavus TaxID=1886 RepID=UPI0033B2CF62